MDNFMMKLKEDGELREEYPVVSAFDNCILFESPIAGDKTKCIISKEAYSILSICGMCDENIGNILLLMCKRMDITCLDLRHYHGGDDVHVAESIIVSLKICMDDEEYLMKILEEMDNGDVLRVFFNKDYMHFKKFME